MKYRIAETKDDEKEVVLRLVPDLSSSGGVFLKAEVNNNSWWIAKVTPEGLLVRVEGVTSESGFQVDGRGRVKETSA